TGWEARGWRRKTGALENSDLWQKLAQVAAVHTVDWRWVRGHNEHVKNEYANALAIRAAERQDRSNGLVPSGFDTWLAQQRARGLPNKCDSAVPGNCGCIHSEMNALVKAPGNVRDKVVFVSASPCVMCAKLIINSGVTHVFYRKAYRDPSGVEVLQQGGVVPVLYDRWVSAWRNGA